jgi:Ca2+-transporting ATPase
MFPAGLKDEEIKKRKKLFGDNLLPTKENNSIFSIFLAQFRNPIIYLLLLVGIIPLWTGEYLDAILIGAVATTNALMGFFQEYATHKTLRALNQTLRPKATVIRNGIRTEVEAKDLVPGDIVLIHRGDRIPADGILIDNVNLLVSEAILTGEEEALEKKSEEGKNQLFMGTTVISGRGVFQIEKIGLETEIGEISRNLGEIKEERTPLQKSLENFTRNLAKIILLICVFILLVDIMRGSSLLDSTRIAVTLSVAAMPEGLPISVTVILAIGMQRILKKNGLVKKLLSIETLGATSVICTDKTGTLTEGTMQVVKTDFKNKEKALLALILANGQNTNLEIALLNYAREKEGIDENQVASLHKKLHEETFDSEKKYALTIASVNNRDAGFILGAPEIVLSFCKTEEEEKERTLTEIESWAEEGLRLVAVAFKDEGDTRETQDYNWLGLVGIKDPIREGVKEAINVANEAGIKIKIVTGDYRKTAEKVALSLGLEVTPENTLEGKDLEIMSEDKLKEIIDRILIFARITPRQKLKIVKILQERGEIVAMTGDGVNDAPALKKADIGVVVGNASDVAKEAGDLILLDGNFKTIVAACEEGRLIFSNIKKVVSYVLSNSFAEIILIFGAMILNLPSPLTVLQILWIQLICDGPPDVVLSFEGKDRELMKEKPRSLKDDRILSKNTGLLIIAISTVVGFYSLFFFQHYLWAAGDLKLARTVAFAIVGSVSLFYIFSFKNLKKSIFKNENFFQNKHLFAAVLYGFVLIFAAIYLPILNKVLGTTPLGLFHWVQIISVAIASVSLIEGAKLLKAYRFQFGKKG